MDPQGNATSGFGINKKNIKTIAISPTAIIEYISEIISILPKGVTSFLNPKLSGTDNIESTKVGTQKQEIARPIKNTTPRIVEIKIDILLFFIIKSFQVFCFCLYLI